MTPFPKTSRFIFTLVPFVFSSQAMAAGFEKAQTWSAKAAAMGGAVVGSTSGAEALFFNPAGLARTSSGGEISGNLSPTLSQFTGVNPYNTSAGSVTGSNAFSPVFGITAAFSPMPKLGIGAGYYVSGGNAAKFENTDYSGLDSDYDTLKPTVETSLAITEAALGAGYEVAPGLRLGAAMRMVMVNAKFSTVSNVPGTLLAEINAADISAKRWNAYKIGMQYEEPAHRWGLGFNFRSAVGFTGKGTTSSRSELATGGSVSATGLGTGAIELDNTFPLQIALGGWTRATELFRLAYEYSYTNYAVDRALEIRGKVGTTSLSSIPQYWRNMHVVRLGGEYTGMGLPLRFGYAYTTQVTPTDYARSTFASPGPGHSFTFGSGMILNGNIDLDGALEYAFANGNGQNQNAPYGTAEVPSDLAFKSHAYVAHLSAKYRF